MIRMERKVKEETKAAAASATPAPKKDAYLDDAEMVIESSEKLEVVKSFDELGIREELLRGKRIKSLILT